jgi:hypothetical protein
MRFLSQEESMEWLKTFDVTVDPTRRLHFRDSVRTATQNLVMKFPDKPLQLTYFLERVADWLPRRRERFLWMSNWATYPPHPLQFFETVRSGCGERRHIIDAPGLLIESDDGPQDQEFSEAPNTSTFVGFVLLVVNFNWQAYLIASNETSHVYLGDEFISFSSKDEKKLKEVFELAKSYKLEVKRAK